MSFDTITAALTAALDHLSIPAPATLSLSGAGLAADLQCNALLKFVAPMTQDEGQAFLSTFLDRLELPNEIATVFLTGRGFINIKLTSTFLASQANLMLEDEQLGVTLDQRDVVALDFGGPNVAKALHVGHLRSFVIGESLRRILLAKGNKVFSDIHLGDWGLQIGKLLLGIEERGFTLDEGGLKKLMDQNPAISDLQMFYVLGHSLCGNASETDDDVATVAPGLTRARELTTSLQNGDPKIVRFWRAVREVSLVDIKRFAEILGAHFDLWLGESDSHPDVEALAIMLRERNMLVMSKGAEVIPVGSPPLVYRSQAGSALYGATDLATLWCRQRDHGATRHVYCVDKRQSQHLNLVKAAASFTGMFGELKVDHAAFGTVNGADGKALKTRDGTPPGLDDLINEVREKVRLKMGPGLDDVTIDTVAVGAIKFFDLICDRQTGYNFDIDRMTANEGKSGTYLQYAVVRTRSILQKSKCMPTIIGMPGTEVERELLFNLLRLPMVVDKASHDLKPHYIAEFAFDVAQSFSRFYAETAIIGSDREPEFLALCQLTNLVLVRALYLLGIDVPDRM